MVQMSAALYVVATPIGNLDDITLRAVETLRQVDLVAAEDTRRSKQLLNHLGISKPLLSVHEHNESGRIERILRHLQAGESIALVSDAGTPLISDPGYQLTRAVIDAGYHVVPIPGVSSIIAALSAAGLPTDHFIFHGFLSSKNTDRLRQLEALRGSSGTHVFFESTHRIQRLLQQVDQALPGQQVVVAKELTKRHERFIRGTPMHCLEIMNAEPGLEKGEFVVLMHGRAPSENTALAMNNDNLLQRLLQDLTLKKAVKLAADITGQKKNDLYQQALKLIQAGKDETD